MEAKKFYYPAVIKETYLDVFGHMNHATYLVLLEEARWEFLAQNGYGLKKIQQTGLGPIILEVKIRYLKELHARDDIIIETQLTAREGKIMKIGHKMMRRDEIAATAELTFGFFNLNERKLIEPTAEWLKAIGVLAE